MRVYKNEGVGIVEIEIPGDPARRLGMVVREKHGELLPGAGKRDRGENNRQKPNGMVQASVFYRVSPEAGSR